MRTRTTDRLAVVILTLASLALAGVVAIVVGIAVWAWRIALG